MINNISGAGVINSSPLISIDAIVDEDLSLILYVLSKIRNETVFDFSKVEGLELNSLIKLLYTRRYKNPLYLLMRDESNKEFLDECYKEFKSTGEYLVDNAVGTDFYNVVEKFKEAGDIRVTILYHNDGEKYVIDNDPLLSSFETVTNNRNMQHYSQLYFRYVDDAKNFIDKMTKRTFYFSSSVLNLNEDCDDFKDSDIIEHLVDFRNDISIFDMYVESVIGKVLN